LNHLAYIKNISETIEEETLVIINGIELTVFASYCPHLIKEKNSYNIEIDLMVFDDFALSVNNKEEKEFIRHGDSFRYKIKGFLGNNGVLDAGIMIKSELFEDYEYIYGNYVELEVDRIDAAFI
jgi:hypothetical protein